MDHTMKISTLLLSSAAVLVAGAAYAADLPAKKAAPAAAPTGCPAFGAGFFAIPGGDTCIKFSGRVTVDQTFADPKGDRTKALDTFGGGMRLNIDARNNTDAGVVRSYVRMNGTKGANPTVDYAYAQIGGFTAGYADSAFITLNGPTSWKVSTDDGAVLSALQYTASLGGTTTATVAVEDAAVRTYTGLGASQVPDLVGNVKTKLGDNTVQLSAATHQNHGATSGDVQGYAFQAAGTIKASADTTVYMQAAYAASALSYLGYNTAGTDATLADVSATAKGWSVLGAVNQALGAGSVGLSGVYGIQSSAAGVDYKQSQLELNYDYTGIKGIQIVPAVYIVNLDNGTTTTSTTKAFLRIERDF